MLLTVICAPKVTLCYQSGSAQVFSKDLETDRQKGSMARLLREPSKRATPREQQHECRRCRGLSQPSPSPSFVAFSQDLIANDLVSVQPMSLPSGLIFFLDFVRSRRKPAGESANGQCRRPLRQRPPDKSIYGGDEVGIADYRWCRPSRFDLEGRPRRCTYRRCPRLRLWITNWRLVLSRCKCMDSGSRLGSHRFAPEASTRSTDSIRPGCSGP